MKCQEVLEELVAFLDGETDRELSGQISQHLESCPECRKEAHLLAKTGNLLASFPDLTPRDDAARQILEKARAISQETPKVFWFRHGWPGVKTFATAAGLLIAMGIYWVASESRPPTTPPPKVNTVDTIENTQLKTELDSYKELLARFREVKEEYYCSEYDLKTLSPYLFSNE
ncbi:MAG: zf-HC2 domain-containing protein [Planctomycetota bacterium]